MIKYPIRILIITVLLGLAANATALSVANTSPQASFAKALAASRQGNFTTALSLMKNAQNLFVRQSNAGGSYLTETLELFLQYERKILLNKGHGRPPTWMRLGWLLKDWNYSGTYLVPPFPSSSYEGVLILTRKIRDIKQGPGRSSPLWGIADAVVIPRLLPGEEFSGGTCSLKGRGFDSSIAAIIMVKGYQQQETFTKIRKAWHLNTKTSKIVPLPSQQVVCANEALGV